MFFCKKACLFWVLRRALHTQKIHYTKTIQGNCLPVANLRDFLQKKQLFTGNSNAPQTNQHQPYSTKFNLYRYIIHAECPLYTHKIHWGRIYAIFCKKADVSWPLTDISWPLMDISWPLKNFFRHPANPLPDWARGHFEKRAKFC